MAIFSIGVALLGCYIALILMRFAITTGIVMFMAAAATLLLTIFV